MVENTKHTFISVTSTQRLVKYFKTCSLKDIVNKNNLLQISVLYENGVSLSLWQENIIISTATYTIATYLMQEFSWSKDFDKINFKTLYTDW